MAEKYTHRDVLRKSVPFLMENIYDVPEILDHLLASEVISWDEKDEISCQMTRRKRLETLLNVLRVKDRRAYKVFCDALSLCGSEFVADELKRVEAQVENGGLTGNIIAQPTDESDWFAALSTECRCRQLTSKELACLSRQLSPKCFFHVGQLMGFSMSRMEQYQASDPYSVTTQIFKMFCDWLAKEDDCATAERLVGILQSAGVDEKDYMDVIKQHLESPQTRGVRSDRSHWV